VVLAIAGILASLSYAGFQGLLGRARTTDSALEATLLAQSARALASSTGVPHALLVSAGPKGGWMRVVRDERRRLGPCLAANPGWSEAGAFPKPTGAGLPCAGLAQAEEAVALDARLQLGPAGGFAAAQAPAESCEGGGPFGAPYCDVPADRACTFCSSGAERTAGAILFEPRGFTRLLDGAGGVVAGAGGSLALERADAPGNPQGFLVTRLGIVRTVGALEGN
jgi:hypothetical protein